ncbi:MAG: dihydroorotase [Fimbriimonadales bacterium]|nr:dihydroorotase [Fimbriimonadales bacterium]
MDYLLANGRVLDPSQNRDEVAHLVIRGGRIAEITPILPSDPSLKRIDCDGLWVAPGLVDIHVHLREPGQSYKETLQTGGAAALAGGFTTICCMPNTEPPLDSPTLVREIRQRAERETPCRVYVVAALTQGMAGEQLCDYHALKQAGAVACSDDAFPVQNAEVMRRAMQACAAYELPVVTHCEDKSLSAGGSMHRGVVSSLLGLQGIPASSETVQIARNALLAWETGCQLHLQHLSTAVGVALVRFFKAQGVRLTCEVCPHHLLLTDSACEGYDTNAKMNPPLRTESDRRALSEGLIEGVIDCIATDHAPHAPFEKERTFPDAPFGIVGLETAFGCIGLWNHQQGTPLSPLEWIRLMSTAPAQILNLPAGTLQVGAPADVVVIDPHARWIVNPDEFRSKGRNTPFRGWELIGKVRYTFVGGECVYSAAG